MKMFIQFKQLEPDNLFSMHLTRSHSTEPFAVYVKYLLIDSVSENNTYRAPDSRSCRYLTTFSFRREICEFSSRNESGMLCTVYHTLLIGS